MKRYKFYIGSNRGECAKIKYTYTKDEIVEKFEQIRKDYSDIYKVAIDGYSLYTIDGYWQGVQETSYVIEIIGHRLKHKVLADYLRAELYQDCVMVTCERVKMNLV